MYENINRNSLVYQSSFYFFWSLQFCGGGGKIIKLYCLGDNKNAFLSIFDPGCIQCSSATKSCLEKFFLFLLLLPKYFPENGAFVIKCNQPRSIQVYFYFDCAYWQRSYVVLVHKAAVYTVGSNISKFGWSKLVP